MGTEIANLWYELPQSGDEGQDLLGRSNSSCYGRYWGCVCLGL